MSCDAFLWLVMVMDKKFPVSPLHHFVTPGIIFLATIAVITLQWSKFQTTKALQSETQSKSYYLLEEKQIAANAALLKKVPALGHDNLVADWAFLNFVQYFGDDNARAATGYRVNPDFFETVVDRDPRFLSMYPYLSSAVTLFSGNPTKSVDLLTQGIQEMPDSLKPDAYFLWQAKATDELLFLGDPAAAQASYEKVVEWASLSADPERQAIAARAQQTAQFLSQNPNSRNAQISSWFNILSSAIDDQTRSLAVQQIRNLGGTVEFSPEGRVRISFPES